MKTIRNVVLLFVVFVTFALSAFAEYKPIPKHLSKQYKADMERIIDEEYPKAIKEIDKYFNDVEKGYNKLKIKYDRELYWSFIPEVPIYEMDLFLYVKLMKVTQEKYLHEKYVPFGTDNSNSSGEFLYRYFKDNNVNTYKLQQISQYAMSKDKMIQKYSDEIDKLYEDKG